MTIKENNQLVKQYGIYLPLELNNLLHTQTDITIYWLNQPINLCLVHCGNIK